MVCWNLKFALLYVWIPQSFLNAVKHDFDINKIEVEMLRNNAVEIVDMGSADANSSIESVSRHLFLLIVLILNTN